MASVRDRALRAVACASLLALAACARQGEGEMSWARAALERNDRIEVVAADEQSRTFTVRLKDSGELRMVRADQLVGGVTATAAAGEAAKAASQTAAPALAAAAGPTPSPAPLSAGDAAARPGEAAVPEQPNTEPPAPEPAAAPETPGGGRVLKAGPGYSIKAGAAPAPSSGARLRETSVTTAPVERRHEPIVCQGQRLLHIDNRNLEFDGDAVSAQDGCEIHITNTRITATGVGVSARAANVHIDNSLIEGDGAAIDASEGAQVYAASTRFRGLSRRADTASFHDLGGNVWN